jgi:hypothetical protein
VGRTSIVVEAGTRRGPGGGWGSDRLDVEADTEEERAHDVDHVTVGEAVDVASRRMWRRSVSVAWTHRRSARRRC